MLFNRYFSIERELSPDPSTFTHSERVMGPESGHFSGTRSAPMRFEKASPYKPLGQHALLMLNFQLSNNIGVKTFANFMKISWEEMAVSVHSFKVGNASNRYNKFSRRPD